MEVAPAGTYTILETTGGTLAGTFASISDLGVYDDAVGIVYTATAVTLTIDRDVVAGDYNADGFVSQADLDLVLLNWGQSFDGLDAPDGWLIAKPMGLVSQNELDAVLLNWGAGLAPNLSSIPEPSALALLGFGGVFCMRRRGAA